MDDIVFINGGTVLLRGSRLLRYDDNLREQGFSTLPVIGDRVLVSGSNALVFSQATLAGGAIGVTRVSLASLGARTAAPVVDATGLAYSPDAVLVDKDATVLLLSRTNRNVFRWSTAEHRYLSPLRLSAAGSLVDYSQTLHRLVIAHSDGRICQLPLAAPTESYLAATPTTTVGLVAAGDVTLACDVSGAWATHFTFAADGRLASRVTWNYTSRVFTWSATNSEVLHFRDSMSPNDLHYEKILADATIGERGETPYHGEVDCTPPIRVSPDGTRVVLGSGQVFNRSDLRMATTLAIQFDDADWVGTTLTTIRARLRTSELQQWSGTDYSQIRSIEIDGYPLRMAALPNGQLLAVTLVQNQPRFYILDASLDIVFQSSTTPPPTISAQPSSTTVVRGSALNLSVTATGTGTLSYQWFFNGNPIAGATSSTLSLTNVDDSRAGTYSVRVSNGSSSVTSSAATVSVTASSSRLINLSARARVGTGADVLIPGFVVSGAAKRVLVRAAGPALLAMGVDTALADPVLELKTLAGVAVASNDDWNAADAATMAQAGAFAFAAGSKDAALVATLAPGLYTPIISGKNGSTGIGLVEVYDLDTNGGRLVNLSARARVGLGADVLIPGLVIQGDAPKRLLLRAAGPALLAMGVDTALADPVLELKTLAGASVASNDDWNAADAATMAQAGAFAFAAGSKDSALVVTLAPGLYTPVISGKNNTTGIALVEVYELP